MLGKYLIETGSIDYNEPVIQEKVKELKENTVSSLDYIEKAYDFVRDEIFHSWDIKTTTVSRKASEVLVNRTGICWTKSCLLAALLRANGIPAGISYQLLTRADEDDSEGYIIHALNNRTNAVVIFAGNESSIELNRSLADGFLAALNTREIKRAEYDLPVPEKSEALIIDSRIQYNQLNISYRALGYDGYEGWMTVAAHIVTDFYMTPLLRDGYGVYDPYCANNNSTDGGIYLYTYQDPNIAESFELFSELPEMLREEEFDQETIDSYILSAYAYFAKPKGILAGAVDAADAVLMGIPQDEELTYMRQLKQCTPEKLAEWAEMLKVLTEEGTVFTAGGAAALRAEADRYDVILDTFGTGDR